MLIIVLASWGCRINYSFTGGTIPADVRTFSVKNFQNRGATCSPTLVYTFRDGLQDKIQSQTSLKLVNSNADVTFEGEITNCWVSPQAIQGDFQAAMNRYTITVSVKYTSENHPDDNFEASFSRYEDFESSQNFRDVEDQLVESIVDQIMEDIFNKAFVNW